jgi:transcriptional regulator with XRE-family HTH domain
MKWGLCNLHGSYPGDECHGCAALKRRFQILAPSDLKSIFEIDIETTDHANVHRALVATRRTLGLTQKAFADKTGLTITAIQNYEKDRVPSLPVLYKMRNVALAANRRDLAQVIHFQMENEIGGPLGPCPVKSTETYPPLPIRLTRNGWEVTRQHDGSVKRKRIKK